jgi:Fur family peroxide stress response transcriptional regulator
MTSEEIRKRLAEKGLKVTPQRIAIMEALSTLHNHPSADNVLEYIRKYHPNIATATVYKVLDTLVSKNLIAKVKTEKDSMRYDAVLEKHHHLYDADSSRIEDYSDDELNRLLEKYFTKKGIPGFQIEDIQLQIKGRFE